MTYKGWLQLTDMIFSDFFFTFLYFYMPLYIQWKIRRCRICLTHTIQQPVFDNDWNLSFSRNSIFHLTCCRINTIWHEKIGIVRKSGWNYIFFRSEILRFKYVVYWTIWSLLRTIEGLEWSLPSVLLVQAPKIFLIS